MRKENVVSYTDLVNAYEGEEGVNQMFLDYHTGANPLLPGSIKRIQPDATPEELWNKFGTNRFAIWLLIKLWKRG